MILVTGATGSIGSEVVRLLASGTLGSHQVRALVRQPSKARELQRLGGVVELAEGDLTRPETLPAALEGVEKLFALFVAQDIPTVSGPLFEAAKRAGVRHVVYLSSATIRIEPPARIGRWHLGGEEALKATGLAHTMLRPGNFASNSLGWAGAIRAQGSVFLPYPDARSAPIDSRDIAAVAARALASSGHEGRTHVLTGPEVLTARQQVEQLGAALGRTLAVVEVPEAGARAGMLRAGMSEDLAEAILELIRAGRPGAGSGTGPEELITSTVRDVTGAPARTFGEWARDHVEEFR